MRIAVDAMGGDHAPEAIVSGAVAAARELGVDVVLVGPEARVRGEGDGGPGSAGDFGPRLAGGRGLGREWSGTDVQGLRKRNWCGA